LPFLVIASSASHSSVSVFEARDVEERPVAAGQGAHHGFLRRATQPTRGVSEETEGLQSVLEPLEQLRLVLLGEPLELGGAPGRRILIDHASEPSVSGADLGT
jgi:hypothetical protein